MSVATISKDVRTGEKIQEHIDAFVEGAPFRSAVVKIHRPVEATWTANPDVEHPAASLLKVPLVGAFLIAASQNEITLHHRVRPESLDETCYPTVRTAFSGSTLTLSELSALAILTSDNAAATCILGLLGTESYRRFLLAANCENTGVPPGFADENFQRLGEVETTAMDQARILEYVWKTECLHQLRTWMANSLLNTRLSARIEPPDIFAHKTGTLSQCAHDVGVLITPNLQASLVVLTSAEVDPVLTSVLMADLGRDLADELERLVKQD